MAETQGGLNYLTEVREQYEDYPYPPRDPEQEKERFLTIYSCMLDCLNYYHFSGKRDFSKGFRALFAGEGTGDAIITLAEQLRDWPADIIYLDISTASMQVAKDRAKVRGLGNITWVHGSLLDAPKLVKGPFDYIHCSGVLHHLESPEAGLAALAPLLKDDGVMGLLLYAKYGREPVYQIQHLMRILNKDEKNMQRKIENCKSVLQHLPATHGFNRMKNTLQDATIFGDVGMYDLLLHSHDVAYSIPELYRFLAGANLQPTHFFCEDPLGNDLYRLESYLKDDALKDVVSSLTTEEKQAAAELLHGGMIKHICYAAKSKTALPSLDDLQNVPFFSMVINDNPYEALYNYVRTIPSGQEAFCNMYGREARFLKTANVERIFKYMDGNKTLAEIFKNVIMSCAENELKPDNEALQKEFAIIFAAFNRHDWMFLRHISVPRSKTNQQIQQRLHEKLVDSRRQTVES